MILLHFGVDFNSRPHGGRLLGWFVLASLLDFNSRPHGGRLPHPAPLPGASGFQLTPSRRATIFSIDILLILVYFNSRPHGGRRGEHHSDCAHENYFNSRPHGGRLFLLDRAFDVFINFNSRPHGGRHVREEWLRDGEGISTHALTEGDYSFSFVVTFFPLFQLTPSRRATERQLAFFQLLHISTHALTEGDPDIIILRIYFDISTHALTEGDCRNRISASINDISTHALTEGDRICPESLPSPSYFNSRPHGGRRQI